MTGMELPKPWHPVLLRLNYVLVVVVAGATAAVLGQSERHADHPLLYGIFILDGLVFVAVMYCAVATDSRSRSVRKQTLGPCANPECSRQVFFNVRSQEWLHYGANYETACIKELGTTAGPKRTKPPEVLRMGVPS
jgi:hypothetical protein